jgi:hypothetical protein
MDLIIFEINDFDKNHIKDINENENENQTKYTNEYKNKEEPIKNIKDILKNIEKPKNIYTSKKPVMVVENIYYFY